MLQHSHIFPFPVFPDLRVFDRFRTVCNNDVHLYEAITPVPVTGIPKNANDAKHPRRD
ncbi:MAG TPA: hypothetical protein VNV85_00395 [Puia sp.]|nr:hypothetical protein [Puia sp.]